MLSKLTSAALLILTGYLFIAASNPLRGNLGTGTIILIASGGCPQGFTEWSAGSGNLLYFTVAANGDVGGTGGSNSITPTGTVSAPTFSGNAGTVPAQTFTGNAGTVPAETFTGNALATHTHTVTPTGTNGTASWTIATGGYAASTTHYSPDSFGGVALTSGSTSITVPAETFTGALDTSSAVSAGTPAGTNSTAAFTPSGTNGTAAFTPAGTNSAPTFSGAAFDPHPAYIKVIPCMAN